MTLATLNGVVPYLRQVKQLRQRYPEEVRYWQLLRFFPEWRRKREYNDTSNPLAEERPWLTFGAIEFLENFLTADMRVFEYGTGGSTLFFLKRVAELVSVEHDAAWLDKVSQEVKRWSLSNWRGLLKEPTTDLRYNEKSAASVEGCVSYFAADVSFREYVCAIDRFPAEHFDLVLIDGRARPSCFGHSLSKVRPGGCIVLDNSERTHYAEAIRSAPISLELRHFPGPSPYFENFTRTSVWHRSR